MKTMALAGAAALASLAVVAAPAAANASPRIHKVPCTAKTLQIVYNGTHRACYEGVGSLKVSLPRPREVLTGVNTGSLTLTRTSRVIVRTHFHPHQILRTFPVGTTKVSLITITRV